MFDKGHMTDAQAEHSDLLAERVEHVRAWTSFDEATINEAARRLKERTRQNVWLGNRYERPTARFRSPPSDQERAPEIQCDRAEMAVMRMLARTQPYGQFSVTSGGGEIFAGNAFGRHLPDERFYVTALCPILDIAADVLQWSTNDAGGRMYVHTDRQIIEQANGKTVLVRLLIPEDE